MDFLSRHYEKMILGACLLFLIASLYLVADGYDKTKGKLKLDTDLSKRSLDQGELVEDLDMKVFEAAPGTIRDMRSMYVITGQAMGRRPARMQGSLIAPADYICCVEDNCRAIILINEEKCPFCGTEQPPMTAGNLEDGEDTDGDGIPDAVEKRYRFLDMNNPLDARYDFDNDGFLNVEEFKAGTAMEDKDDFPELGTLIRVGKVIQNDLKVQLRTIDQNGSEDASTWDLGIRVPKPNDPRGFPEPKRSNNRNVKLNAVINIDAEHKYRVIKAGFENKDGQKTPYIELASVKKADETYKLYPEETVKDQVLVVRLVYLRSRLASNAYAVQQKFAFNMKIGDLLPSQLFMRPKKEGDEINEKYREYWRLESANEDGTEVVIVKVDGPKAEANAQSRRFQVPQLGPSDFYTPIQQMGDGMMGPGMMDGGGMMMR